MQDYGAQGVNAPGRGDKPFEKEEGKPQVVKWYQGAGGQQCEQRNYADNAGYLLMHKGNAAQGETGAQGAHQGQP